MLSYQRVCSCVSMCISSCVDVHFSVCLCLCVSKPNDMQINNTRPCPEEIDTRASIRTCVLVADAFQMPYIG